MSMLPQYIMLAPLVFIGPLFLQSFEVWDGSSFLAVAIGSLVGFAIICFVTPWVIPRYGRRLVTVVSFTMMCVCVCTRAYQSYHNKIVKKRWLCQLCRGAARVLHGCRTGACAKKIMSYVLFCYLLN